MYDDTLKMKILLYGQAGSTRYSLLTNTSDHDVFALSTDTNVNIHNSGDNTSYFVLSLAAFQACWGHPLFLGNITGRCTGNKEICDFLQAHKQEVSYAAPEKSALLGLGYIAVGERDGLTHHIKTSLRTAMILAHMAGKADDPFLLSEEEKSILIRARTGDVPPEKRVDIYRRTISPENINRLLKMPDHPTIKNELFQLIDDIISKEEFAC